jgi:hypothetical protein
MPNAILSYIVKYIALDSLKVFVVQDGLETILLYIPKSYVRILMDAKESFDGASLSFAVYIENVFVGLLFGRLFKLLDSLKQKALLKIDDTPVSSGAVMNDLGSGTLSDNLEDLKKVANGSSKLSLTGSIKNVSILVPPASEQTLNAEIFSKKLFYDKSHFLFELKDVSLEYLVNKYASDDSASLSLVLMELSGKEFCPSTKSYCSAIICRANILEKLVINVSWKEAISLDINLPDLTFNINLAKAQKWSDLYFLERRKTDEPPAFAPPTKDCFKVKTKCIRLFVSNQFEGYLFLSQHNKSRSRFFVFRVAQF